MIDLATQWASSSVGESTALITLGSVVRVHPGLPSKIYKPPSSNGYDTGLRSRKSRFDSWREHYSLLKSHMLQPITVQTLVDAPIEKVWEFWNKPEHIKNWAFASDDWEAPAAKNDLQVGGKFVTTMAAKDKSASFDLSGTYTKVVEHETIEYTMDVGELGHSSEGPNMGRKVSIKFETVPEGVHVTETFDPENKNPEEMQRAGWQAILENFKKYVENK